MCLRYEAKRMEIRIKRMNWKMYNVQALGFWKRQLKNEREMLPFLILRPHRRQSRDKNHPSSN